MFQANSDNELGEVEGQLGNSPTREYRVDSGQWRRVTHEQSLFF